MNDKDATAIWIIVFIIASLGILMACVLFRPTADASLQKWAQNENLRILEKERRTGAESPFDWLAQSRR